MKALFTSLLTSIMLMSGGPSKTIRAPVTRYHGYELNRASIARAKRFTVLISWEGFGHIERGTGVLLDPTHVLTCDHVARGDNEEMKVYSFPGDEVYTGRMVFDSQAYDLAIVELDRAVILPNYAIVTEGHYDGEPITIIGNILGSMKWFVSYGIVSGENMRDLYTDGLVLGGDSGGPWINEQGEIVALSDWALGNEGHALGINGGISGRTINRFLESWKKPSLLQLLFQ